MATVIAPPKSSFFSYLILSFPCFPFRAAFGMVLFLRCSCLFLRHRLFLLLLPACPHVTCALVHARLGPAWSCLSCPMSILPCPDCPGSVPGRMHLLLHIHLNWLSKGTRVLVMSNKSLGDSVSQCSCRPCPSQVSLLLGTHQAHGGGHDGMRGGQVAGLQLLVTLRYRSRVG